MIKATTIFILLLCGSSYSQAQEQISPDTITISSGKLLLKALLWKPTGDGPFPAIIFSHGAYETNDQHDPVQQTSVLGEIFAKNGYVFLGPFRRGTGLSKDQGLNAADLMAKAFKEKGQEERNKVQMQQLQTDQLEDMISALSSLRQVRNVDTNRIAVLGHSFGGSLAMLVAQSDRRIKAVVIFGAAGHSWNLSPQLRTRLFTAAKNLNAPVMISHAQNDYSINPGYALDSIMNLLHKPHVLKIYPNFGKSQNEGHNLIFLRPEIWKTDVITFLLKNLD